MAKGEVHPSLAAQVFQRHQVTRRREQGQAVPQGLLQITGGVQHVGGDQQIVAVGIEALGNGILLDIQGKVFNGPVAVAKPRFRFRKETRRDIGIDIVELPVGKLRQHRRRGRTGTSPDLEHPQSSFRWQLSDKRPNDIRQQSICGARHRRFQIEIGGSWFSAAEQKCQWIHPAAQHVREGVAGPPKQTDLDQAVGIQPGHPGGELDGIGREPLRQRIVGAHFHDEPAGTRFKDSCIGQQLQHSQEEALVVLNDIQALPQRLGNHGLVQASLPPQLFQGAQGVGVRPPLQVREQGISVGRVHTRVCQVFGEPTHAGGNRGRRREEIGGL